MALKMQMISNAIKKKAKFIWIAILRNRIMLIFTAFVFVMVMARSMSLSDEGDITTMPLFSDTTDENRADIETVYMNGIMFPVGGGRFGADEPLTRNEAAYIAVWLYEWENGSKHSFDAFYPESNVYIEKAEEYEIMPLIEDDTLSREDAAAVLWRFVNTDEAPVTEATSVPSSFKFAKQVLVMFNHGVILDENLSVAFSPDIKITRGETARLVRMILDSTARVAGRAVDFASLSEMLTEQMSDYDGDWSLYYEDTDSGEKIVLNNRRAYSASLIKLYVAMAVCDRLASGEMEDTSGVEDELTRMITYSDNNAWNLLARRLGGGDYMSGMAAVTELAASEGFTDSGQFLEGDRRNFNFTSVEDCGTYLHRLLNGEIVSPEYSEKILDLMKQQEILFKIPAGVPEDVETANKTGELEYMQGDAAIVYAPSGTYILVVIADNITNEGTAQTQIRDISETVYNFLNP